MSDTGYAFLVFPDVDKSQTFMDQHRPTIFLGTTYQDDISKLARADIAYSHQDEENLTDWEWTCENCVGSPRTPRCI